MVLLTWGGMKDVTKEGGYTAIFNCIGFLCLSWMVGTQRCKLVSVLFRSEIIHRKNV